MSAATQLDVPLVLSTVPGEFVVAEGSAWIIDGHFFSCLMGERSMHGPHMDSHATRTAMRLAAAAASPKAAV